MSLWLGALLMGLALLPKCAEAVDRSTSSTTEGRNRPAYVAGVDDWFVDATAEAGISVGMHPGYGQSWGDFDGDGWLDVWIGNHMYKPTIYRNDGDGTFTDVTQEKWDGVIYDFHAAGWADFDNDGDQDLSVLVGGESGKACVEKPFYVSEDGKLVNRAIAVNLNDRCGRGQAPLWLDWNNDGLLDLYMVSVKRPNDALSANRLMLQQPGGTFTELTAVQSQSTDNAFGQLLYLAGAVHLIGHTGQAPYPSAFYRVGDSTPVPFQLAGGGTNTLYADLHDVAVGDFDGDLQDDLFMQRMRPRGQAYAISGDQKTLNLFIKGISSERGVQWTAPGTINAYLRFWSWRPTEIFLGTNAQPAAVTKHIDAPYYGEQLNWSDILLSAEDPRLQGVAPADSRTALGVYLGRSADGKWQLHARGSGSETLQLEVRVDGGPVGNVLATGFKFRNDLALKPTLLFFSGGKFVDLTKAWRMNMKLSCPSITAGDFDNDMDLDLVMNCTGPISGSVVRLFENKGGSFVEAPIFGGAPPAPSEAPGGAVTAADYNQDGYLDVLVSEGCEVCGPPGRFGFRRLLKNVRSGNHSVQFDLIGCQSSRDAIGARVIVDAGGKQQMRLANGGSHEAGQDQRRIHFGLAQNTAVSRVTVEWPSGAVSIIDGLAADHLYRIQEDPTCVRP